MRKALTLLDVARAAQVSKSTAANAFSRPNLVRAELLARIKTAAHELGYGGPDPKGRMLSLGKVNAIGILPFGHVGISQFFKNHLYQRDFLAGVAQACEEQDVGLSLVSGRDDQQAWGIKNALVDGFIFTGVEQVDLLPAGRRSRLPFVVMDLRVPDIKSVSTENRDGARQATRHLIALGHRRFVIASPLYSLRPPVFHPPPGTERRLVDAGPPLIEKLEGVADALAESGMSINDVPIAEGCGTPEEEQAFGSSATMLLDKAPEATAVIALTDNVALSILHQAKKRGLDVPRDLSIVGFDDVPEAALSQPPLTTVHVSAAENGRAAVLLLLESGPPRQVATPVHLVVRASTAPPRG
jgi:DNA-binding LacI/PurR family transcriptional regulator